MSCSACPRLVEWREHVAAVRRAAYADEQYWGRPVPGFGDPQARILILGLAPAAHGANRTGRMFTGDRSGDFLFAALHRAGLANQANSTDRSDGLTINDCWITAAVRCAPPNNKPTPIERDTCSPFLAAELRLLPVKVVLALGKFAWDVAVTSLIDERPKPGFAHGAVARSDEYVLIGSYHVSQQNTFTGRLTPSMIDGVLDLVRTHAAA